MNFRKAEAVDVKFAFERIWIQNIRMLFDKVHNRVWESQSFVSASVSVCVRERKQ